MSVSLSKNRLFIIGIVLLTIKLWLVSAHPLMTTITPHDDLLFVSQANAILSGEWLGEYNQLTLIKGPFYALFIALSYYLNIPLLLAQQILYALASFAAVCAVAPIVRQRWLLAAIFIFLLFNPFSYNYPAVGRVFRLGIYAPLGLLVFSTMLGLVVRTRCLNRWSLVWSFSSGICLSAFWNTREESIWIAPSLLVLFVLLLVDSRKKTRAQFVLSILLFVLPLVMLMAANQGLKTINNSIYRVPAVIELKTPEFKSAYGGLLRVKSKKWRQFYPVVRDVREKVYKVSPAFRELESYLDGSIGIKWQRLCGCSDIPAAFFIWAFRDSVAAAGYYQEDGQSALSYYRRLGDEIDQACAEGTLDCRPRVTSLVPTWHQEYNKLFFPTFFKVLRQAVSFEYFSASTENKISKGSREIIQMYETVTGEKALTSRREMLRTEPDYHRHLNHEKVRILNDIGSVYQLSIMPLFLLSVVIFLFCSVKSLLRRDLPVFTAASGAALGGILSITFILTLLTITSYSEIQRALHSVYPMVLLFIISALLDVTVRIFGRESADNNI